MEKANCALRSRKLGLQSTHGIKNNYQSLLIHLCSRFLLSLGNKIIIIIPFLKNSSKRDRIYDCNSYHLSYRHTVSFTYKSSTRFQEAVQSQNTAFIYKTHHIFDFYFQHKAELKCSIARRPSLLYLYIILFILAINQTLKCILPVPYERNQGLSF
ncbi:hypothetical protein V6Z11_A08G138700 [Gossypium hirsutum]